MKISKGKVNVDHAIPCKEFVSKEMTVENVWFLERIDITFNDYTNIFVRIFCVELIYPIQGISQHVRLTSDDSLFWDVVSATGSQTESRHANEIQPRRNLHNWTPRSTGQMAWPLR